MIGTSRSLLHRRVGLTSSGISLMFGQSRRGEHPPATFLHNSARPVKRGSKQVSLDHADDVRLHLSGHISYKADSLWVQQSDIKVEQAQGVTLTTHSRLLQLQVEWRC